jgi:peptidoglycan/LPS O-acetylase OafA/YrhL
MKPVEGSAAAFRPAQTIPSLDGIRAVSFMLVFIAHIGLEDLVPGGFGVTIFFFLSGYLITTLMRMEYERNSSVNLRHFWLRRALRILPPFYLVLLVAALVPLVMGIPDIFNARTLWPQLLHVTNFWIVRHGYEGLAPGTGVYWSLAVEEHFYLLFPWLYIAMRRGNLDSRKQAMLLYSLCALVLAWRCVLVLHFHADFLRTYLATDARLDAILFGCALAVRNNPYLDPTATTPAFRKGVLLPLCIATLLASMLIRNGAFRETLRYSVQGLALTGVFVVAVRDADSLPFRVLNLKWVAFIGTLSYSLYLLHQTVLFVSHQLFPDQNMLLRGATTLLLSICVAWAIHAWVEKPCARLRRRLVD